MRQALRLLLFVLAMHAHAAGAGDPAYGNLPGPDSLALPSQNATTRLPSTGMSEIPQRRATRMKMASLPREDVEEILTVPQDFGDQPWPHANETRTIESTLYTRLDYFYWDETVQGQDFMHEAGFLPALGLQYRNGHQRMRGELFGSQVSSFDDTFLPPLPSETNYLGLRGEYELVFDLRNWPKLSWFTGLGTRFWHRNLPDIDLPGLFLLGYQESWWTFYPYLGLETRRTQDLDWNYFARGRIGMMAFTYEHVTLNEVILYPRQGLHGLGEIGLRGQHGSISAMIEVMQWSESAEVRGFVQPSSVMLLAGMRAGYSF